MAGTNEPITAGVKKPQAPVKEAAGKLGLAPPIAPPKVAPPAAARKPEAPYSPLVEPETDSSIYEDEALHLEQAPTPQPETLKEKEAAWRLNASSRKMAKKEAAQTAVIVLALLDGTCTIAFGENAGMLDYERELIKEPLERIIQRMDIVSSEALAKWSDPILLFMGLSAWITRVIREKKESQPEVKPPADSTQEQPPKDGRPKVEEVYLVEQLITPQFVKEGYQGRPNEF